MVFREQCYLKFELIYLIRVNSTYTNITNDTVNYKISKNEIFTFIFISVILYNVYKYVLYNCFNDLYLIFKTKIKNFLKKKKLVIFSLTILV